MKPKYFIIREAKCDENKVYNRSFVYNTAKGYTNLEEAKKELYKLNEMERLEAMQEAQREILDAKLNNREYARSEDGYHHVNVIVRFRYYPVPTHDIADENNNII